MRDVSTDALENIYSMEIDENALDAGGPRYTPAGTYLATITGHEVRQSFRDPERTVFRLAASLYDTKQEIKVGTIHFDVSPILKQTTTGAPDRESRLWAQLYRVAFPASAPRANGKARTAGEVLETVQERIALSLKTSVQFQVPTDTDTRGYTYKTPFSLAEHLMFEADQYKGYVNVERIGYAPKA